EPLILAKWQAEDLYGQLRKARAGREKFIFHDGPPYANGDIHIGHSLNRTLKDMVVRSQTLLGKDAPYVPGWDCHGLPIEWKIEEQYRKKKLNKDEVPVKEFRAECRAYAQHWVDVQKGQIQRLGCLGEWDKPYLTMDFDAEATIVSELFKFADSGQLYRGAKPVMWSPVEKTALAEAEIEYEDITSTQIDVAFDLLETPNCPAILEAVKWCGEVTAVVWTTTPWTIPVNQGIAYNPEVEYVLFTLTWQLDEFAGPIGRTFVVAAELQDQFVDRFRASYREHAFDNAPARNLEISEHGRFPGEQLRGATADHPMSDVGGFFAKPRPLLAGAFVTTDQGTGLVHMAPDHGEDDFELCKAHGIDPVFAVQADGRFRDDWAWPDSTQEAGRLSVINPKFNAPDGPICSDLRNYNGLLSGSADFQHSYPHSWRSKAKVIYRCTPQWFVAMDKPLPAEHCETFAEQRWDNEGGAGIATPTLRQLALRAIDDTRFVPDKGRNRIGSMVEGRPDWVLSRQRAWGVPIALFVHRKSGELLVDSEVNARIVAAIRAAGVDAWDADNAAAFLGPDRNPDDYEMVTDILDVWFDSGCTHVFTLESGKWPEQRWPADLYLEGSDQHRGWFQSSLLESCGTRGRAPYDAILTHGFTMDAKGMKMSKSLGNTINPLDLMKESGADILRLWALSVDFTEDHRIGKEILAGVGDQYRKLRNTFRYLLGALDGFEEGERVAPEAMPELERYMLHLAAELNGKLRQALDDFDFNSYTRLIGDFANNDLSAFYFDIRKDVLYCEVNPATGVQTDKRRAYRTVLVTLFHALVRWCAPVLVFTAEEVWGTRYPDGGSVHLLEWPEVPAVDADDIAWAELRILRTQVTEAIEPLRRDKVLGSSLEAAVVLPSLPAESDTLAELFIVSSVMEGDATAVTKTDNKKCGRCWRFLPEVEEDGSLCARCDEVVHA
ncbi:MAG TPA: isoleucine--tRNA ligase, partial [Sphingomicrobium sp.]|nr:isoleucine--tRNA ligase [Sphingomicrobium sp.]